MSTQVTGKRHADGLVVARVVLEAALDGQHLQLAAVDEDARVCSAMNR